MTRIGMLIVALGLTTTGAPLVWVRDEDGERKEPIRENSLQK